MAATRPAVEKNHFNFNDLSPLDRLPPESIDTLLAYARVERIPPGRRLFNKGESDGETVFLLSGQLALITDGPIGILRADTPEARAPIADHQPRRHTAIAHTSATILCINAAVLDSLLRTAVSVEEAANATIVPISGDPSAPPSVSMGEIAGTATASITAMDARARDNGRDIAWPAIPAQTPTITELPPSPLFDSLPPAHLQMLKLRLERIDLRKGNTVARAGENCHYFHVVESGGLRLGRRRGHGASHELQPGDSFGEDLLVAGRPYDVTATAIEDTRVLRLPRPEFLALVARHHMRWIAQRDLPALMGDGRWLLLDIRPPAAFRRHRLHGSVNLPLPLLADAARALDPAKRYVLCCDSTRRLATAAFLLARHGIKTRVLAEGVKAALSRTDIE